MAVAVPASTIENSAPAIKERFFRGTMPVNSTPLLTLTAKKVLGIYVIRFTAALAAGDAALERKDQNFTVTNTTSPVTIDVGDLVIPFNPAIGTAAGEVPASYWLAPTRVVTKHIIPVGVVNTLADQADPDDTLTLTALLIKTASSAT